MVERFRQMWEEDRGGALALVAMTMVLLLSTAAFGTDLAWFYINSSRTQRAADAAALGGVIWLPGDTTTAFSTAHDVAVRNGYDDSDAEVSVTPATVPGELNQLEVTINSEIPTFFLRVIGFNTVDITQTAVAEYIPPLKLGSPEGQFGNACDPEEFGPSCGDNFWANIHGKWTESRMGDAFAPQCQSGDSGAGGDNLSCTANPLHRPEGYLYGIESAGAFTLEFVDLAFHNQSGATVTGDHVRTGDRGCEDWGPSTDSDCGPTMIVNLYPPDPTPLDLSDNGAPVCTATVGPEPQVPETTPYSWETPDGQGCWTQSGSGTWVVQVMHEDPGSVEDRSGLNRYSIRSTSGNLFALRDFSIYNNASGSVTSFYLAEVPDFYAGKTFVIELFDPGESADAGELQVVGPDLSVWDDGECRIYSRDTPTDPWSLDKVHSTGSDCLENVDPKEYHNRWLKFEVDLPGDYSCDLGAGECWWKMNYDYPSNVQDTTTWRAFIIGNPIHLVS